MRNLATIREVRAITPIPNADFVEAVSIDGWVCVCHKGECKVGEKIVYFEIDSLLPQIPVFEFMEKSKFRVKTIKLRGQISQGLIMPIDIFTEQGLLEKREYKTGEDVSEKLMVTKWEPKQPDAPFYKGMRRSQTTVGKIYGYLGKKKWGRKLMAAFGDKLGLTIILKYPNWIEAPKTDEERIQNLTVLAQGLGKRGTMLSCTEKVDGTSATYFYADGIFGVCSRNLWLVTKGDNPYWEVAEKYNIKALLKELSEQYNGLPVVLQGEILGPDIQKNKYGFKEHILYAFSLYAGGVKMNPSGISLVKKYNINCVPFIDPIQAPTGTVTEIIQAYVDFATRTTTIGTGAGVNQAEGVVFRDYDTNTSFKCINPKFLLKWNE